MVNPHPDHLSEHAGFLKRLAQHLLRDEERAEDAVQDAYVAVLQKAPPPSASTRGWLAGVVRNIARRRMRTDDRRRKHEARAADHRAGTQAASPAGAVTPADAMHERLGLQRRIAEAVQALPEPTRSAIVHRYLDGHPPRKIAEREGVSVRTIESRLRRGREALRETLDSEMPGGRTQWHALLLPLVGDLPLAPLVSESASHAAGASASATSSAASPVAMLFTAALVGVGGFVAGSATAPSTPPRPLAEQREAAPIRATSPARPQLLARSEVRPDVRALRMERDLLQARVDRLRARTGSGLDPAAPLLRRIAAADAMRASTLPPVLPEGVLERLDWGRIAEARATIGPVIARMFGTTQADVVQAFGEMSKWNQPLSDLAITLARARGEKMSLVSNWGFTEPAVQARLVQASLVFADEALSNDQLRALHVLALHHGELDEAGVLADKDEIAMRRRFHAMERRAAFFRELDRLLTPSQSERLSPQVTRGRIHTDLLSESVLYMGTHQPVRFREPQDLRESALRLFLTHFKGEDPAAVAVIREEIARWVEQFPAEHRDELGDEAAEMGWLSLERVRTAHREGLALFERIIGRLAPDHPVVSKLREETVFPLPERVE